MKVLIILALAALAYAESDANADPWVAYRTLGYPNYGLRYSSYAYPGYVRPSYYSGYRYLYKRDADSDSEASPDAEADPAVLLYSGLRHPATVGYTYPTTVGYHYPTTLGYVSPYYNTGYRYLYKREAEADSEADPWVAYRTYGYGYPSYYSGYRAYSGFYRPYARYGLYY